jgi:hypothetical protein
VRGQPQTSVYKYDTQANTWTILPPMPHCDYHSVSVLDEMIYIVGAGISRSDILRFGPASGSWSTLTPTAVKRVAGVGFVLNGCLYAAGGHSGLSSVERYDTTTDSWTAVAVGHCRRYRPLTPGRTNNSL